MEKKLREQVEEFFEYNKEIGQLCAENFKEKKEKSCDFLIYSRHRYVISSIF